MPLIACRQCGASINLDPGTDPHSVTWCRCCPIDHHHAEGNTECAADDSHVCWDGTGPKPPGCAVCRPVIHYANANLILVQE